MCYHKRLVFRDCFHYGWGPLVKKCDQEKAFDAGEVDEGCSVMVSHPLSTLRVAMVCNKCAKTKMETDTKFTKAREVLAALEAEISKRLKGPLPGADESNPKKESSESSEVDAESSSEPVDGFTDPDETLITAEEVSSFLENKFPMVSLTMDI